MNANDVKSPDKRRSKKFKISNIQSTFDSLKSLHIEIKKNCRQSDVLKYPQVSTVGWTTFAEF